MQKDAEYMANNPVLKTPQYGNCLVLSPEGQLMFRTNQKKIDWYLARNLAIKVDDNPVTIQLNFIPNGNGHVGDPYHLQEMKNQCVVCGSEDRLTRHHIVPYCYRRFFPQELKQHKSYDVLALCFKCHMEYERVAGNLKLELEKKYNIPVFKEKPEHKELMHKQSVARAILGYRDRIPEERLKKLYKFIGDYLGKETVDDADLNELINRKVRIFRAGNLNSKKVLECVGDIKSFMIWWREHFCSTMNPQYLPEHWSAHRI